MKGAAPDSESASSAAQLEAAGASAAAGSAAVIAADQRGNDAISARIRSRIDADPSLKDNSIAIETEDGTVRLSGSVPTNAARRRAADLALTVRGVVTVVDNVSVRRTA